LSPTTWRRNWETNPGQGLDRRKEKGPGENTIGVKKGAAVLKSIRNLRGGLGGIAASR